MWPPAICLQAVCSRCTTLADGYGDLMTTEPGSDSPVKDPQDWATGDEPPTQAQLSYLETLAHDSGTDVPTDLTKAKASQLIDELRGKSPRLSAADDD
jgi:hypothetical protein